MTDPMPRSICMVVKSPCLKERHTNNSVRVLEEVRVHPCNKQNDHKYLHGVRGEVLFRLDDKPSNKVSIT